MGKRLPLRARIGVVLILIAGATYGGWEWWMATRTWVPLDMPVSLARGHVHSPEFKINLDAGFSVSVEVETKSDEEGVSCLVGYTSDYCQENAVGELRAAWTLSDSGRVVARGSTDSWQAVRGGMLTKARGLGDFSVRAGHHYVLDVDFPEDNSRFDAGHPRLTIAQSYDWSFEEERAQLFLLASILAASGAGLFVSAIAEPIVKRRFEIISLTATRPAVTGSFVEAGGSEAKVQPRLSRMSQSVWLGLVFILVGVTGFISVRHWYNTLIFVPVDMPVSLAAGHIRTRPFRINLERGYSIWIALDQNSYFDPMCSSYSLLQTKWVLYRGGRVADQWDTPVLHDTYLEGFQASKGLYELDVEVLADASCLNANRPRLKVVTYRTDYEFYATVLLWSAALCVVVGASLLVLAGTGRFKPSAQTVSITGSETIGQNFQWAQKLPLRQPISGLPGFGLVGGIMFAIFAMLMMMLTAPMTSQGLWVHLLKPGAAPKTSDAFTEPLVVRVKDAGLNQPPTLYVNSKQVAWGDFDRVLKQELGRRSDWVVYVEGEDMVSWERVTTVIDAARGYHAKVFLVGDAGEATPH